MVTALERANYRHHTHSTEQIVDPDTGEPFEPGGGSHPNLAAHETLGLASETYVDDAITDLSLPQHKYDATAAPTVTDDSGDGYSVGSVWIDVTGDAAYICVDASVGAAVWVPFEDAGGGANTRLPAQRETQGAAADPFDDDSLVDWIQSGTFQELSWVADDTGYDSGYLKWRSNDQAFLYKTVPAGDFVATLVLDGVANVGNTMLGILLANTSNTGRSIHVYTADSQIYASAVTAGAYAGGAIIAVPPTSNGTQALEADVLSPICLRLRRVGSNVSCATSWDGGRNWSAYSANQAETASSVRLGICKLWPSGAQNDVWRILHWNVV